MRNKTRLTHTSIIFSGVMNALATPAFATSDFSLVGGVGLEAHDNAGLVSSDEQSDTRRTVSADVGYKKTDGAVDADINYRAEYGDYIQDVQSDETLVDGRADLIWHIAPRQLDAVLYHQISQQLTDRRGLDVASNREERSVITAGLDGFLHLSPVDSLVLAPRVSDVHFQESDSSDSKRASLAAILDHKVNSVTAIGVKANYDDVKFDGATSDYNSPSMMLSIQTALSRLSYEATFGVSRVNRDNGKDYTGPSVVAGINYRGDEGQDWGGSYVNQLTDSSVGLSGSELQLDNFQSNDSNFGEVDIVQIDQLNAYWRNRLNASNLLSFSLGFQREDYKETLRDEELGYVQIGYQYTLNSRWSIGADTRFERTKFLDDPRHEYDTTLLYLNATYRPSRPLEVRFSVGQDERDADTSSASYIDHVALIGLRYHFF